MAFDWAALANEVSSVMAEFEFRQMTLTKLDRAVSDSTKPWRGGGTSDTIQTLINTCIVPMEAEDEPDSSIRMKSAMAYVAAKDVDGEDLKTYEQLLDGLDTWRIEGVKEYGPGSANLLYVLILRK